MSTSISTPQGSPQGSPQALDTSNFRRLMETIVDQHTRSYTHCLSISFHWDNDDTRAKDDTKNFQDFLRAFGFPRAKEYVISSKGRPGHDVRTEFASLLTRAVDLPGRIIVFCHYAGRGEDRNGELLLTNGQGKYINAARCFFHEVDEQSDFSLNPTTPVDVVFIFDSCYSHLATRGIQPIDRVVEILAASDDQTPTVPGPGQYASFTAKLANEVAARKGRGDQHVDLAELVEHLRAKSPVNKPVHAVRIGFSSIRLRFPGLHRPNNSPQPPSLQAVFSFRIAQNLTQNDLAAFITWMRALPSNVGLTLENVYETTSMCLVFRSSYGIYSKLAGLPFVQLICETRRPNLLPSALEEMQNLPHGPHPGRENVPMSGSPQKKRF